MENISYYEKYDKLVRVIAGREYYKYSVRVKFTKLDLDDFYQNGWLALQDCINKDKTDLSYICVAMRNAMYRGVTKTSIISTTDNRELWYYISGHEDRMENNLNSTEGITFGEVIPSDFELEGKVIESVLVDQIMENVSKDDKEEILRLMNNLPPKKRKIRENAKKRAKLILEGKNPYKSTVAEFQSSIKGVVYDKSKKKWAFAKRVDGKQKTFYRDRKQQAVEKWAINYYKQVGISSEEYYKNAI